jgi:hypothetical protein
VLVVGQVAAKLAPLLLELIPALAEEDLRDQEVGEESRRGDFKNCGLNEPREPSWACGNDASCG